MTAPLLSAGSLFASRWIVGGVLGQGELAAVYEAEEAHQRRFAALKLFHPSLAAEPAWSEHVALTRALSDLPGDGIARAYDTGIDSVSGRPYVASERITFPTLSRYVTERGPLSLRVVAQALMTLGAALDGAHAAGIVHGGLRPQNVFVSFDNPRWARLTDFALVRLRGATGHPPTGLLGWSAPEAAAGFHTPDGDRYALALVCFFAATGLPWYNVLRSVDGPPSDGPGTRVASERAKRQGGELDPLFDAWFAKALAADPAMRFTSGTEMAKAFVDVFASAPTAELEARSSVLPWGETLPMRKSQVPGLAPAGAHPLAATVPIEGEERGAVPSVSPLAASRPSVAPASVAPASVAPRSMAPTSLPPPGMAASLARPSLPAPGSAVPSSASPVVHSAPGVEAGVPRWFWFASAGFALLAILGMWWLSQP